MAQASPPTSQVALVRIEPPRAWLELRLREVWMYRELLYFLIWRDLKGRYKQTVIGVAWVVLQPIMSMGANCGNACAAAPVLQARPPRQKRSAGSGTHGDCSRCVCRNY